MKIQFILVEPKVPENIGASARAIKTMGFDSLVLVNPCQWKEGKARWVAHGSEDILENTVVFPSLSEALAGSDIAVATSAKQRTVKQDYIAAPELASFLADKKDSVKTVSIVFGREESGLKNEEMALCDVTSSIAIAQPFPSLNLSQAVMLFAYELSRLNNIIPVKAESTGTDENSFRQLKQKIRELLLNLEIDENDNRFGRIMERIAFLKHDDINLLHSVSAIISAELNIHRRNQH